MGDGSGGFLLDRRCDGIDKGAAPHSYQDKRPAGEKFGGAGCCPIVMARLVRAICSSRCAATGGPDKPGHDGKGKILLHPPPYPDTHGAVPCRSGAPRPASRPLESIPFQYNSGKTSRSCVAPSEIDLLQAAFHRDELFDLNSGSQQRGAPASGPWRAGSLFSAAGTTADPLRACQGITARSDMVCGRMV
jgi:hypothetical protein